MVLALLAVVGGYRAHYPAGFEGVFSQVPEAEGTDHLVILLTSLFVLAVGAGTALAFYRPAATDALVWQGM